ncbi:hypothetical protein [Paenibacillus pinihumi]|uniref:hypothetical protein n=1 Tax=Paenibacillus pinihumi TaxID=669462 RepID=UPI000426034A|nr:hypothetical protein [Paenibacillus pinihumi]
MLTPISIRTNYMKAQTPFFIGFLLPDSKHAIYISEGSAYLLPVIKFAYEGLYAQDGKAELFANVPLRTLPSDEDYVSFLYGLLTERSAFDLLTGPFDRNDTSIRLLHNDESDHSGFIDRETDVYGRSIPDSEMEGE